MIAILLLSLVSTALCAPQWPGGPAHYAYHAPAAPLGPDGRVIDTPEVAQAKSAHFAALAEAAARAPKGGPGPYDGPAYGPGPYLGGGYAPHYSGPPAPLGPDGRVIDTPEVAQAKAVHFSLYSAEAQKAAAAGPGPTPGPYPGGPGPYNDGSYNPAHDYY
ncbi:pupal cuticle protein-like [Phymastichus coffea]|uniref:pupal cuticle protein-like n=1 Tax=Phymastichus coffea TaxID=108790 RepID=UPI00273BB8E4|nr:pupal cuticle protein-like [Phymastichus coffea]